MSTNTTLNVNVKYPGKENDRDSTQSNSMQLNGALIKQQLKTEISHEYSTETHSC